MNRKIHTNYKCNSHLGLYLISFLKNHNLGIKGMAVEMNMNTPTLRGIIRGSVVNIKLDYFLQLADYMSFKSKIPVEHYLRRMKEEYQKGALNNEE